MTNLKLNLLQNGLDSLRHASEHFLEDSESGLKYSILHLSHSIELLLKERLAKEHDLLIFSKPENSSENAKTVTLDETIKRLSAAGIHLSNDAKLSFEALQRTRNKVQHYQLNLIKKDVEAEIGRNVKYIIDFLRDELSILLEDYLPKEIYSSLRNAIFTYEELAQLYKNEMLSFNKRYGIKSEPELCPECGHFSIIYPDPRYSKNDMVKCFFCKSELEVYKCSKCAVTCFLKENIYHACACSNIICDID
ncbi:MAG: zinc ribbon domain-containing protein [Candidatus Neomarinimicrobiota bacterium]